MSTVRFRNRLGDVKTKAEKDLDRMLPPVKEDLNGFDARVYGVSTMGEHTVAGVEVVRPYASGEHAQKAADLAKQADRVAQDARRVANLAQELANAIAGVGGKGGHAALESGLGDAAVDPHATARELLKIRTLALRTG